MTTLVAISLSTLIISVAILFWSLGDIPGLEGQAEIIVSCAGAIGVLVATFGLFRAARRHATITTWRDGLVLPALVVLKATQELSLWQDLAIAVAAHGAHALTIGADGMQYVLVETVVHGKCVQREIECGKGRSLPRDGDVVWIAVPPNGRPTLVAHAAPAPFKDQAPSDEVREWLIAALEKIHASV